MFEKRQFLSVKTVDKTENANNNEIKIFVLHPASLKSQKTVLSDILVHKYSRKCEILASFSYFHWRKNVLISSGSRTTRKF